MRARLIWALVAFVVGLAAATFYYVRNHPAVTEDELREVVAELDDIPALLDEIECERPALLGAPTRDALSFEDLLTTDGPFAGCWAAVSNEEWQISIADGAHFEGYDGDDAEDDERVSRVLVACSELPAEAELQARTPNRCMLSSLSSERWQSHLSERIDERSETLFGTALAIIAAHSNLTTDAKLRLLMHGIATARDFGQGPSGWTPRLGAGSEMLLGRLFGELLREESPSHEARAELREPLNVLAEMPIDFRTLVISSLVGCMTTEAFLASHSGWPEFQDEVRSEAYAAATLIPRVLEACAPDTTNAACAGHFPFPSLFPPSHRLFGPRAVREKHTLFLHARYVDEAVSTATRMQEARSDQRALQRLLRWSAERAEGRCPEPSEVETIDLGESDTEFRVERIDDVYTLHIPGSYREPFSFRCPLGGADDTTD